MRSNKKKTHEEYVVELAIKNPDIEVVGTYVDAKTKILHRCKTHDVEWMARPDNILRGKGCPKCAGNNKKSHERYVCELLLINPNIKVVGSYINALTPITHKCLIHNIEWEARPNDILGGKGCPACGIEKSGNSRLKTHTQYVEELKLANKNIIVIENYKGANTPILHKCLIDGCEWYATPHNILCGTGCPRCNESKGEKAIRKWLIEHGIKYDSQKRFGDCCDKIPLPFDFYLSDYNCCIEYDGIQHYQSIDCFGGQESLEYTQLHDRIKTGYCQNNNIRLLRISYLENIEEKLNNFLFI